MQIKYKTSAREHMKDNKAQTKAVVVAQKWNFQGRIRLGKQESMIMYDAYSLSEK